jgi:hypothetical protein
MSTLPDLVATTATLSCALAYNSLGGVMLTLRSRQREHAEQFQQRFGGEFVEVAWLSLICPSGPSADPRRRWGLHAQLCTR